MYISTQVGITFLKAGRIDEAIERQKATIGIYPGGFLAHLNLGEALEVKGLLDEAIESYEKAVSLSHGNPMAASKLACAWYKAGKEEEALQQITVIEQMKETVYIPASSLIPYYLLKGDRDRAFHWFKKAVEERDLTLTDLVSTPIKEHQMPDDPRFTALLEETGLIHYIP